MFLPSRPPSLSSSAAKTTHGPSPPFLVNRSSPLTMRMMRRHAIPFSPTSPFNDTQHPYVPFPIKPAVCLLCAALMRTTRTRRTTTTTKTTARRARARARPPAAAAGAARHRSSRQSASSSEGGVVRQTPRQRWLARPPGAAAAARLFRSSPPAAMQQPAITRASAAAAATARENAVAGARKIWRRWCRRSISASAALCQEAPPWRRLSSV
eukprot:355511-Chlamydomonas_euryale.AAC.1